MDIAVVVVTYNRLECLKIALSKYEKQKLLPKYLIVVDNASTDGTNDYLNKWMETDSRINRIIIHNDENVGGAGGFNIGMKECLKYNFDYVFLADDDAYAEEDTFEKIILKLSMIPDSSVAAVCTSVINHGTIDISHRCRVKKGLFRIYLKWIPIREYRNDYFPLDIATFVGTAIKKETVEAIGFPIKDYFIYYDDSEYYMRINEIGSIYCITESKMIHDVDGEQSICSWKGYYDTRNWLDAVRRHYRNRYFIYSVLMSYIRRCSWIATVIRKRNGAFRKMCKIAIRDARKGVLGISDQYYPGKMINK